MLDVWMLGTGTPVVDPVRCGSGTAITSPDGWFLVDRGRGIAHRVAESGLDVQRLNAVLLTHHHSDHVSDLASLAIMRWVDGETCPLPVICPHGPCCDLARTCLESYPDTAFHGQGRRSPTARPTVDVACFVATESPAPVYRSGTATVSSALVDHHPIEAAVGYRFEIRSSVVVVSGDTAVCPGIEMLANNADVLIHEALRGDIEPPSLLDWNASAEAVGSLAARCDVKQLVLTHLLSPSESDDDVHAFVSEVVAEDLLRLRC